MGKRVSQSHVFVNAVVVDGLGRIIVEASNGKKEGPPFVRFELPRENIETLRIAHPFVVTIEEVE